MHCLQDEPLTPPTVNPLLLLMIQLVKVLSFAPPLSDNAVFPIIRQEVIMLVVAHPPPEFAEFPTTTQYVHVHVTHPPPIPDMVLLLITQFVQVQVLQPVDRFSETRQDEQETLVAPPAVFLFIIQYEQVPLPPTPNPTLLIMLQYVQVPLKIPAVLTATRLVLSEIIQCEIVILVLLVELKLMLLPRYLALVTVNPLKILVVECVIAASETQQAFFP